MRNDQPAMLEILNRRIPTVLKAAFYLCLVAIMFLATVAVRSAQVPEQTALPGHFSRPPAGTPWSAANASELFTHPDLVVVADVVGSRPGRVVGEDIEPLEFEATTIEVIEVLAGDLPARELVVETERIGIPYEIDWRTPDTRILAFLWLKRDPESAGLYYRPIAMDGVYLVDDTNRIRATVLGEVASAVSSLGLNDVSQMRTAIHSAREP